MRISTIPSASSVRNASRATERRAPPNWAAQRLLLSAEEVAGSSRLPKSASRTSATMFTDNEDERPPNMMRAVRSPLMLIGCRKAGAMAGPFMFGPNMPLGYKIVKMLSFGL